MSVEERVHRRVAASGAAALPAQLAALVRQEDPLRPTADVERTVEGVRARLAGLGPLEPLLADPEVTDVMVNGPGAVWVERAGRLAITGVLLDRPAVDLLVERIVGPIGRRADPSHPFVDGRLADGSRVHVVVPPLAVEGPCITIRRFGVRAVDLEVLSGPDHLELLRDAVRRRRNVVVSGATGSGKTTLLNALAALVDRGERIVTVEDAAELRLGTDHVVRLEARPAMEGLAPVTIRDLVRNALRMRPDRIVVGEVRGPEAVDLLAAMNTGHDGSLTTVHANSALDALARLEVLVLMAGIGLPADAVRAHLRAAVDLVVHMRREPDGRRRVHHVHEVRRDGPWATR